MQPLERTRRPEHDFGVVPLEADELLVGPLGSVGVGFRHVPKLGELDQNLCLREIVGQRREPRLEQLGALAVATELRRQSR